MTWKCSCPNLQKKKVWRLPQKWLIPNGQIEMAASLLLGVNLCTMGLDLQTKLLQLIASTENWHNYTFFSRWTPKTLPLYSNFKLSLATGIGLQIMYGIIRMVFKLYRDWYAVSKVQEVLRLRLFELLGIFFTSNFAIYKSQIPLKIWRWKALDLCFRVLAFECF